MIIETAKVISKSNNTLQVEAVQHSSCGTCAANKECGQGVLARLSGSPMHLQVSTAGSCVEDYQLGETIEIGVPEDVVVRASLLVYIVPLISMLLLAWFGHQLLTFGVNPSHLNADLYADTSEKTRLIQELSALIFGFVGLLAGTFLVRVISARFIDGERAEPRVILDNDSVNSGPAQSVSERGSYE